MRFAMRIYCAQIFTAYTIRADRKVIYARTSVFIHIRVFYKLMGKYRKYHQRRDREMVIRRALNIQLNLMLT